MDTSNLIDENLFRFVAILNKNIDTGRLMNALGHLTAGLAGKVCREDMQFLEYRDNEDGIHPGISHFPFIVLAAENSNKIRIARKEAISRGIPYTDFTSTMIIGTSQQQIDATRASKEDLLDYYGLCLFGRSEILMEFTGKFSLFK